MYRGLSSAVYLSQLLAAAPVRPGGTAVDATVGNGKDTLFLAGLVGPEGRVYAFDIQEESLRKTRSLLEKVGLADRVILIQSGHEEMEKFVQGPVDAVIFNLGYLPGGDHTLTTRTGTTARALQAALELLRPGGRAGLVIYTGHPGGREEGEDVEAFSASLDGNAFRVIKIDFINRNADAPMVIVIEKAGASNEGQTAAQDH